MTEMNLIEQLGGYDEANRISKISMIKGDYDGGVLAKVLIEYRRQSNIFEVGDYFCYESKYLSNDPLDGNEYEKLHRLDSLDFACGWVDEVMKCGGIIRHATDSEIKAGRRL